ncbi:G protein-coupled receptor 65 [Odontesthes bonariensis]
MENLTLATNYSECFSVDSASTRRIFMFFYLAVIITAIPANVFSLYVSWRHIRHKNDLGVYLFNLALSDLNFTLGLSLWLDFLWRGVWVHGGYICMLSIYSLLTNFYTSEALLCCIALNRYLAVVHPLKYTSLRRVGTAAVVTVVIWVLVIGFNATTIDRKDSYYESKNIAFCFDIFFPLSKDLAHVSIARFCLGFLFPLVLIIFFTWGTCLAVKTNQATKEEERTRISKLLTVVLLCLLFCFGPIHVIMVLRAMLNDCKSFKWFVYSYKISTAMTSLNCLLDPLLYCFITRTGQKNVKQAVVFFLGKKKKPNEVMT